MEMARNIEFGEQDFQQRETEKKIGMGLLQQVLKEQIVKDKLTQNGVKALAHPDGGRVLDIAFVPKERKGGEFVGGLKLFARPDCIGVFWRDENESYVEVERRLRTDNEIGPLMEQGASVVIVTNSDLTHWKDFYKQVEEENWMEVIGEKVLDYSGLGRTDEAFGERFNQAIGELLEGEVDNFVEAGVARVGLPSKGKFDRAFLDHEGHLVGVPLRHVRIARLQGELLEEEILSDEVIVPGMVVRESGESKREAYLRAQYLARRWKNQFGDVRVEVPVISRGQLSIWEKMGMWEEVDSVLGEVGLKAEEVIRFLFLGKSNLEPGELARMGLSLPTRGKEFKDIDIVFTSKVGQERTVVDRLIGLDPKSFPKWQRKRSGQIGESADFDEEDGFKTIETINIGGIVLLSDEMAISEIKAYAKVLEFDFNYRTSGSPSKLLWLTPRLFEEWIRRGTAFELTEDKESDLKRRVEYGFGIGSDLRQIDLVIVRAEAEIGGKRHFVVEVGQNGDEVWYPSDAGATFNVPAGERGLMSQSRQSKGVMSLLKSGQLPMIPGLVHPEYILGTVASFPYLWKGGGGDPASYIRSEIVHRGLSQGLVEVMIGREMDRRAKAHVGKSDEEIVEIATSKARDVWMLGIEDEKKWYQGRQLEFGPAVISHPHADHDAMLAFYSSMDVVTGNDSVAYMRAKSRKGNWKQNLMAVADIRNYAQGRPYSWEYRNFIPVNWDEQKIRLSESLYVQMPRTNHSVPSRMTGFFRDTQPLFMDTHDFKVGPLTENAVNIFAGVFPIVITESTNTLDWTKPSTGITEEVVADTMEYLTQSFGDGNLIVVVCPSNHIDRVNTVREVMTNNRGNRKVALGPQMAEVVEQLRAEKQLYESYGVDGFDLPLAEIGEDVALYASAKNPRSYERSLRAKAVKGRLGIVDEEQLSEEGKEWVIVLSSYDYFKSELEGVSFEDQGLTVLHAAHYAYERETAERYAANIKWVSKLNREIAHDGRRARYFVDFEVGGDGGFVGPGANYQRDDGRKFGLHASGHATFEEVFSVVHGLLGGVYKDKTLILVHGEHPYTYKRQLIDRFMVEQEQHFREFGKKLGLANPGDLKIISKLDTYDPNDPLKKKGFRLKVR